MWSANEQTAPALVEAKRVSCLGLPHIIEVVGLEFLERGYFATYLKSLQLELRIHEGRRDVPAGLTHILGRGRLWCAKIGTVLLGAFVASSGDAY
jgi:hypothetical protein